MTEWITAVTVLSVSPIQEDHSALERCLAPQCGGGCIWTLRSCLTFESALSRLREGVPIVVSESDLRPATWRDLLQYVSLLPDPPPVIVTSRLADEHLWAEALNLGAYDVLAKPFNNDEVRRVLESAWRYWVNRHSIVFSRPAGAPQAVCESKERNHGGDHSH